MSYKLEKPYTDKQKADFIVEYNHKQGLTIEETEFFLYALEKNEIMVDDKPIIDLDYEEKAKQKKRERINKLTCTKRVLILALEQLGFDYFETIQPMIESDRQAKLEWELCKDVERSNPLLEIIGQQLGITLEQIDNIFIEVNNGV